MLFVFGFICIILLIAAIIAVAVAKRQSKHHFSCHYCGKEFQPKWTQLIFETHVFNEHVLKCPLCKMKGFCTDLGKKC